MTTKVEPTVEKWDMSCKPNGATFMITDSVFNAIEWEKHYTVKERQALNDVVDEIIAKAISHSVQEAKAEMIARIEGMRVEDETHSDGKYVYTDYKSRGYNQALDDLLASLKQEEEKI